VSSQTGDPVGFKGWLKMYTLPAGTKRRIGFCRLCATSQPPIARECPTAADFKVGPDLKKSPHLRGSQPFSK
jgi:hypothetical protein